MPMINLNFKMISLMFRIRDIFSPPVRILREAGIQPSYSVLDYGCGPGSFSIAAAEIVGASGKIYALDIHPLAVQQVRKRASQRRLANVETIQSDCATGLPDSSVDVALLYDIYHLLDSPKDVLQEIHRVLKPGGILSFSDHHMDEPEIVPPIISTGLFKLLSRNPRTYTFKKV
ncbi:MAG: methyltransferase domain-containing protein [Thaumarchaeota archaeon]|nr:methyltransferase domain-containing protein [Nitrososphaerota archaeon]